ncbi:MAG: glycosyltransferase [Bacteroidetes bacterium]|nr:glycosyltransferase [Bacteroidota bacterium]
MRRLTIGVWKRENYASTIGGGFTYYAELIDCISKTKFSNADICFLGLESSTLENIGLYKYHPIKWRLPKFRIFLRFVDLIGPNIFRIKFIKKHYESLIKKQNESLYSELKNICDIIYYPYPMCQYPNFPFIYTLWDLGHFSSYAFPEVSNEDIFESRKDHHDKILFKALMILCESQTGKTDAINYLRLNEDRLKVLPLFPSGIISEKIIPSKPQIINNDCFFIHYPAQFWAHKNHYNLISAFSLIAYKYPLLKLLLTGSDQGNKSYILNAIKDFNLEGTVIDLGFVTIEELKWLYLNSKGLVMPTLLGPTNMPPLEALALGCPVAASDLPGHHEQMGDNAIYFNPLDIEDIKDAIENLITSEIKHTPHLTPTIHTNMALLDKYFLELTTIRQTWC